MKYVRKIAKSKWNRVSIEEKNNRIRQQKNREVNKRKVLWGVEYISIALKLLLLYIS